MATLSVLRQKLLDRLVETSSDSHFTTSQLNGFLNEAQEFVANIGSGPDKNNLSSPIVTSLNVGDYTNPSNDLIIQSAWFGTTATSNDVRRLTVVSKRALGDLMPNWMDATVSNAGEPKYLFRKDKDNLTIVPRPSSTYAGKNIYLFFGGIPTEMSADSDSPDLLAPYHNVLVFFAARLAYYSIPNAAMAKEMMDAFTNDYKSITQIVDKESEETFAFKWGKLE